MKSGLGYNGEALDDTGLIYLRARYYNPKIGQFIQLDENRGDIENVESQNRYAFARQNSTKYIDKNGCEEMIEAEGGGGSATSIYGIADRVINAIQQVLKPIAIFNINVSQKE